MSAEAAIARLLEIHPKGFDLSLDRIRSLLKKLGDPHLHIPPVFHVAGTNGKGSTAAFLRAILEASGKKVHVHTSPHLVNWNERYRIGASGGGKLVEDTELEEAILQAEQANGGQPITVFEIMSAVAFLLFRKFPADYCIIEVGLGGRFDATNVIANPVACLITPIGLDHEAYLGNTLEKIAYEKAGIIKNGAPVIVGLQDQGARDVIVERARECGSNISVAREDFDFHEECGRFIFQDETGLLDMPIPSLVGEHQLANAALAIAACRKTIPELENDVFADAMVNTSWPGRMERLQPGLLTKGLSRKGRTQNDVAPEIWIDGGHNPHAANVVSSQLSKARDNRPLIMIVGMLTTKEPSGFFSAFTSLAEIVFTVPVSDSDAGFDPAELADKAGMHGFEARPFDSLESALEEAVDTFGPDIRILICGSLYLVGEVLGKNGTSPQ